MALVGSVSGSGANSTVAISGSVIVANRPNASFPVLPGGDAVFFVSGNIAPRSPGSPAASPDYAVRGTTVFGGDVVISGTLFGGSPLYVGDQIIARNGIVVSGALESTTGLTGSLTRLTDGTAYLLAGANITLSTGSNGAVTITSTGGGGGSGPFTEASNVAAYTTSSIAIGHGAAASDKGADLFFFVSGSTVDGTNNALFSGQLITSGSVKVKNSSGNVVASISNGGVISGSGDLQAGGNITGSNVLASTLTVTNGATFGGGFGSTGTTITDTGNISTDGNVVIAGDLTVNGTTTTIDSTTVSIQDPVIGVGFTSGSATRGSPGDRGFIGGLDGENNVAMIWDETADGFAVFRTTSSTTSSLPVDVVDYSTFRAGKLELGGGTTAFVTSSNGTTLTAQANVVELKPNTGGVVDFKIDTTSYINFKDGGAGNPAQFGAVGGKGLILSGATITLNAGGSGLTIQRNGAPIGFITGTIGVGSGMKITAGDTSISSELVLSGSTVTIGANGGTTTVKGGTIVGDQATQNLFNTVATTTLNIGGGASVNIGSSGGTTTVAGALQVNGNTTFGNNIADDLVSFANAKVSTTILPNGDRTLDLGSSTARWANIYTGDLHLRNERGDYTLIEEPDALTIRYNKTGKRYRILVERAPEYDG